MKITLAAEPAAGGRRELAWGDRGAPGWFTWAATQHDLDDLAAVLALDTAKARACGGEHGEHTCILPPGHAGGMRHQCRACPRQWP